MNSIKKKITFNLFLSSLNGIYRNYFQVKRSKFGFIDKTAKVRFPILIKGIENVYLYEKTCILGNSQINATRAKFIMKMKSAAAEGLLVVTGNHPSVVGEFMLDKEIDDVQEAKDVIVEEDVWIAANVTLLAGVKVGRGSIVGSGSVCRSNVPPYSIVIGNPAKVVGFRFLPEEIIEHEKALYEPKDRIIEKVVFENYLIYFVRRAKEIKSFLN